VSTAALPVTRFEMPTDREATSPPEYRGLNRDDVRLLVAQPGQITNHIFRDVPELLDPGDVLVVNTSATLPAALSAQRSNGTRVPVHVATTLDDGAWVVEVRRRDGRGPDTSVTSGDRLELPSGQTLELTEPYPDRSVYQPRLWRSVVTPDTPAQPVLARHGRPISYGYLNGRFPLADYQTVYATVPGSAEMPSAGRPFTAPLLVRLMARGVTIAPLVLHAGVSSPETHEPPTPERFNVPDVAARLVNGARAAGGRVIAVGTTVVRALETVASPDGTVQPGHGWTELVLGPDRPSRVVNGLITGLHAPEASHLVLLEAVAGPDLVAAAYEAALDHGYLWHEFGDSMWFDTAA